VSTKTALPADKHRNVLTELIGVFLGLGCTSFGGPIAHLGYFRAEFVERRRWLNDQAFADLVALCKFLPGPASSQVGFGIGLLRGGVVGGIAAWAAFTLPSAILMLLFAYGASDATSSPLGAGAGTQRCAAVNQCRGSCDGNDRARTRDRLEPCQLIDGAHYPAFVTARHSRPCGRGLQVGSTISDVLLSRSVCAGGQVATE
jgi:hypothetical protein